MRGDQYMWNPGADPSISDDLMEEWTKAVLDAMKSGTRGKTIEATLSALVDHLTRGNSVMVKRERDA